MNKYLTTSDSAKFLGVSYDTFTRSIAPKLVRYQFSGPGGRYSYAVADLEQHVKRSATHPQDKLTRRTQKGKRSLAKKLRSNPLSRELLERIGGEDAA